jgi:hypothetical protein
MNAHFSIPQDAKSTTKEQLLKAGYQELGEFDSSTKKLVRAQKRDQTLSLLLLLLFLAFLLGVWIAR